MKYLINILFVSILFATHSQQTKPRDFRSFGWTKWESDTTFNDDGTVQKIDKIKLKKRFINSTTSVYKHKITEFDSNGKWVFKQKTRGSSGCFHNRNTVIWTRRKKVNPKEEKNLNKIKCI